MEAPPRRHVHCGPFTLRGLVFRLLALLLGLAPFLVGEGIVRLAGWQPPGELEDPYIGFAQVRPLFELDASKGRYQIARSRQAFFQPDGFAAKKDAAEFRIFALGGSTVQGRPFSIETSFTSWLELSLRAADPSRRWEVVNCGGVSYASYRLAEILREVLRYEPDLIILYTGHNEFLEDRTYRSVKQAPAVIRFGHGIMSRWRLYGWCRQSWLRVTGKGRQADRAGKPVLPTEVDALLDYNEGLKDYHRDDRWRQAVIEHFRFNLYRMARMARQADVPMLLVNPVANLKDCPPFKVEARQGLSDRERSEFERLWDRAKGLYARHPEQASRLLRHAMAIDDRHAGVHFHLATCYMMLGRLEEAKREFVRAKDEDICPLRILEPMRQAVAAVGRATHTPVVDLRPVFEARARNGIIGDDLMIDHVHPKISMHQVIADALLDAMIKQGMAATTPGWKARREKLYHAHLDALPPSYFPQGQQRLQGLRRWTEGRSPLRRKRTLSAD